MNEDFISLNGIISDEIYKYFQPNFTDCEIHGNAKAYPDGRCIECCEKEKGKKELVEYQKYIKDKKSNAGIKPLYIDCTFDNYKVTNPKQQGLVDLLKTVDLKTPVHVLLIGSTGCGKTHLSAAMIDLALRNNVSALYVKFYELADMQINDKQRFKEVINCKFLVIDEYGRSESEYNSELLFKVIDKRWDNMATTMLVSNLDAAKFKESLSDALYSRIKENCVLKACDWEDYRLIKKEPK